jgi:hypothetical protein
MVENPMRRASALALLALAGCALKPGESPSTYQHVPQTFTPMQMPNLQAPAPTIAPGGGIAASWTGEQAQVQTVTNQVALRCTYRLASGQTFYRIFQGTCPPSVGAY